MWLMMSGRWLSGSRPGARADVPVTRSASQLRALSASYAASCSRRTASSLQGFDRRLVDTWIDVAARAAFACESDRLLELRRLDLREPVLEVAADCHRSSRYRDSDRS